MFLVIKRPPCSSETPRTGTKTEDTAAPSVLKSLLSNSKQQTATPTVKQEMDTQDTGSCENRTSFQKVKIYTNFLQILFIFIRKILPISFQKKIEASSFLSLDTHPLVLLVRQRLVIVPIRLLSTRTGLPPQNRHHFQMWRILSSGKSVDVTIVKDIK